MQNARAKKAASYSKTHAEKKAKDTNGASVGVIKKFKDISQINDGYAIEPLRNPPSGASRAPTFAVRSVGSSSENDFERNSSALDITPGQPIGGKHYEYRPDSGSSPPLPYEFELKRARDQHSPRATAYNDSNINKAPAPPPSKYFDYGDDDDDYGGVDEDAYDADDVDDGYEEMNKKMNAVSMANNNKRGKATSNPSKPGGSRVTAGASATGKNGAPPLPYEKTEQSGGPPHQSEKDQIYFSRKPRPVDFTPCSLEQYKASKPKEYVMIEKNKPDLNTEELKAKRANLERVKEFSRNLHQYNKQAIREQPKLPPSSEKHSIEISKQNMNSSRQRARDFSKNVPKPKVKPRSSETNRQQDGEATRQKKMREQQQSGDIDPRSDGLYRDFDTHEMDEFGDYQMLSDPDAGRGGAGGANAQLLELEARHNQGKLQIAAICKTMGLK